MTNITIDIREALAKLDPKDMERAVQSILVDAANELRAPLQVYPPPKETYRQTGTLGRGWGEPLKIEPGRVTLGNNVAYAKWVQGAGTQAWMHKGRWKTTATVARQKTNDIRKMIERALARWAQ